MKKLVMKYQLRGRYFEKCEEDNLSGDETTDDKKGKAGKKRAPSSLRKTLSYLNDWLIVRRRSLPNLMR